MTEVGGDNLLFMVVLSAAVGGGQGTGTLLQVPGFVPVLRGTADG